MKFNFKKILLISFGVLVAVNFLALINSFFFYKSEKIIFPDIDGRNYRLLIAKTPAEKIRGLSGVSELKNADGMIFYFNPPQKTAFWNKGTRLNLELIWMRDNKIIGRDFLPAEEKTGLVIKESPSEIDAVVELIR